METILFKKEDPEAMIVENDTVSISNTGGWEIYSFINESWQFLEKKEGNIVEVLTYMYALEQENLGIKINNQITKF